MTIWSIWKIRSWPMTTSISSLQNTRIKELRKLKDKKYRMLQRQFLIEGRRFVEEALRQRADVQTVLYTDAALLERLPLQEVPELIQVSSEIFKDLSDTVHPQGILSCVGIPQADPDSFCQPAGLWLYLDEIRDPGNLGTIIRSAHAFAASGLILSKGCADPYQDKVLRATMGSIFKVPLLTDQTPEFLAGRIQAGGTLYLADLADSSDLAKTQADPQSIVVIGNEAHGVNEAIRALPHRSVRIAMPGGAESLNAAVAAALFLYEFKGRSAQGDQADPSGESTEIQP